MYRASGIGGPNRHQRGVVLFIALIALMVLTLAGVSIMRTVDSSMSLAGNLAFRQSALVASDVGVNTAYAWLSSATRTALWNDDGAQGYTSNFIGNEPDWTLAANWPSNSTVTISAPNGNIVSYRIFRLCNVRQSAVNAAGQTCNTELPAAGTTATNVGNSRGAGAWNFAGNLLLYYRIIVRVVGPRNTATYVQVLATRPA